MCKVTGNFTQTLANIQVKNMIKRIREKIHLRRLHKSDDLKDKEIETILKLWDILSKKGDARFDKLLNVCLYSLLVNRDIYYLAEDYYFQKNKNRKNFIGRLFCMTIVEFLDDINVLLGKELSKELEQNNMLHFQPYVRSLNKHYSKIKKKYGKDFREIRNQVAAHRSLDSKLILDYISKVPTFDLTKIGQEISAGYNYFNDLTNLILDHLANNKISEGEESKTYNLIPGVVKGGEWKKYDELFGKGTKFFRDPPFTAVFTTQYVIEEKKTITYVTHEDDDGAWQFHSTDEIENPMNDSKVIALLEIAILDPSIFELSDMPMGFYATRKNRNEKWQVEKQNNENVR